MLSQITEDIFISGVQEVLDKKLIDSYGITHIVNCCAWGIPCPFTDKSYSLLFLGTTTQTLEKPQIRGLTKRLNQLRKDGNRILFHCFEGKERAPSVVIAYLCENGMTYTDAYNLVKAKHPEAQPTPEMMKEYLAQEVFGETKP
jgi:protein-tyrosine phosphatase